MPQGTRYEIGFPGLVDAAGKLLLDQIFPLVRFRSGILHLEACVPRITPGERLGQKKAFGDYGFYNLV